MSTSINTNNKHIAIWLLVCCATIFAMIILGGVTRLTGSGLSMVQWEPIMGVLPPLNQSEWEETFLLYQQYPEYKLKNFAMSLGEFKSIFWFEYGHRLLGRSIGIIFLLPFLFFLIKGKINRALTPKLIAMFVLGGLQGLMGWYMVKSGLVDDPHVSQYRLTAHLALAIIIYAYIFWVALDLLVPRVEIQILVVDQLEVVHHLDQLEEIGFLIHETVGLWTVHLGRLVETRKADAISLSRRDEGEPGVAAGISGSFPVAAEMQFEETPLEELVALQSDDLPAAVGDLVPLLIRSELARLVLRVVVGLVAAGSE